MKTSSTVDNEFIHYDVDTYNFVQIYPNIDIDDSLHKLSEHDNILNLEEDADDILQQSRVLKNPTVFNSYGSVNYGSYDLSNRSQQLSQKSILDSSFCWTTPFVNLFLMICCSSLVLFTFAVLWSFFSSSDNEGSKYWIFSRNKASSSISQKGKNRKKNESTVSNYL